MNFLLQQNEIEYNVENWIQYEGEKGSANFERNFCTRVRVDLSDIWETEVKFDATELSEFFSVSFIWNGFLRNYVFFGMSEKFPARDAMSRILMIWLSL